MDALTLRAASGAELGSNTVLPISTANAWFSSEEICRTALGIMYPWIYNCWKQLGDKKRAGHTGKFRWFFGGTVCRILNGEMVRCRIRILLLTPPGGLNVYSD
jgi:hypothetical protein